MLLPHHKQDLESSGITPETADAAGLFSETSFDRLAAMLNRKRYSRKNGPGLCFPYVDASGAVVLHRIKPDRPPVNGNGHSAKYLGPSGMPSRAYFPPGVREQLAAPGTTLFLTEGEKKALRAAQDGIACIGLAGVESWHAKGSTTLLPDLSAIDWKGRPVKIVFDSDAADNENVKSAESLLAATLATHGAKVKIVRLPPGSDGAKVGLDDYLLANGVDAFWKLASEAVEPEAIDPEQIKRPAADLFPETVANLFLRSMEIDGAFRLRFWRETFWHWVRGQYRELPDSEIKARVIEYINRSYFRVGKTAIGNVIEQLKGQAFLSSRVDSPAWLDKSKKPDWNPQDLLICKNAIIHLPSLYGGSEYRAQPTPSLFTTTALDFDFVEADKCPEPVRWLQFLDELWPDDQESIDALQLWFGYCLTADARQHKLLCMFGPKRGGKTTLASVLSDLVGAGNVGAPTLSSFSTNFGLWPLVGRTLAIIGDARLSGRSDAAVIAERLLSITGQDPITIDRKFLPPTTVILPCRIMILSNELPRLTDSSGTLISRMIVLRLTESWYGREDLDLRGQLKGELPGIAWWAIDGWRKLQERRKLLQPESGAESVRELEDLASPVRAFLRERCEIGDDLSVKRSDLFEAYSGWCGEMGKKHVLDDVQFGRDLHANIPFLKTTRPRIFGRPERFYSGLALQEEGFLGKSDPGDP